MPNSTKNHYR